MDNTDIVWVEESIPVQKSKIQFKVDDFQQYKQLLTELEVIKKKDEQKVKRNQLKCGHLSLTDRLIGTLQICNSDLNMRRKETVVADD